MKKGIITLLAFVLLASTSAFSQVEFTVKNNSNYKLFGLMVSQDGQDWSEDLLTDSEFPNNTQTVVTIPEGYNCTIYFKVTYKGASTGDLYEEVLGTADVCNHSGIKIVKNPSGVSGNWMNTVYLD